MITNTIQELQLIKRTAWVNANRPRGASDAEAQRMLPYAVNAIVYTAVLNGALYDLKDALIAERTMDDRAKKVIKMLHHKVHYAHSEIFAVFSRAVAGFGKLYNDRYANVAQAIEDHVSLNGADRYYNIVCALLRLIRKNNRACGRFCAPAILDIEPNERRFIALRLPYEDRGDVFDRIIDCASAEFVNPKWLRGLGVR